MTLHLVAPTVETVDIDAIRPYWRNPREISETALGKVRESIERYGYQNPIIVDTERVIVTGHTRYQALRALGVEHVPVIVSDLPPGKAKEYRILDNKTAEYTTWDDDLLRTELREWEQALLTDYFPSIDLDSDIAAGVEPVTPKDLQKAQERIVTVPSSVSRRLIEVVCPHCFTNFEIEPPED